MLSQPRKVSNAVRDPVAQLAQARSLMERSHAIPRGLVPQVIADSWHRCLVAGLDPHAPPALDRLAYTALEQHRTTHDAIRRLALAEMQALHQQLGTNAYVLAFAAPDGVLLDSMVADSHRADIEAIGISPGTHWQETRFGTNALGTVAALGQRVTVRGAEHFFTDHNRLTCIAAPIFGPDHLLAGVLDASCAAGVYAPHARAMVALAAAQIEAKLFRVSHAWCRVVALHGRVEFLDTAYAGLLALDGDDRIIAANDQARFMLAGLAEPKGAKLAALFERGVGDLFQGSIGTVSDRTGRRFHARIAGARRESGTAHFGPSMTGRVATPDADGSVIVDDPVVRAALDMAGRAAQRGLPVLIRGETGTGKEIAARFAHRASGRNGKFVAVNCAAIPPDLLAASLFGHAEGAFTGARRGGAVGLAVDADGGTLFLDEIGDLPAGVQAALLRFLDDFSVRPLGGRASKMVDVLLLAATNVDLAGAVAAGRFRADLYYRLATAEINLPPLRERADFAALTRALLASAAPGCSLAPAAITRLAAHDWPGNIRELRNTLVRLSLTGGERIEADDVSALLPAVAAVPGARPLSRLRDVQTQEVVATLDAAGGNVSTAARRLGVSRNTIYRAIRSMARG